MRLIWIFLLAFVTVSPNVLQAAENGPREYLLAPGFPNSVHIFDAKSFKHVRAIKLPGAPSPSTATLSPDGKTLFVVTNRTQTVVGIDLPSGRVVFQANVSSGDERVTIFPGVAVSADGSMIYVHESPVELLPGEYKAKPQRIAVFRLSDGVGAKAVRTFPSPPKVFLLLSDKEAHTFYTMGDSLYKFDGNSGKILQSTPIRNGHWPGLNAIDYFPYWAQGSQRAGVFSAPFFGTKTVRDTQSEPAFGIIDVDLKSGAVAVNEILDGDPEITHIWHDPVDRQTVYSVGFRLTRIDMKTRRQTGQVSLDHAYKQAVSSIDGKTIFIGGGLDYILAYDADTLTQKGILKLPGDEDQGNGFLEVAKW